MPVSPRSDRDPCPGHARSAGLVEPGLEWRRPAGRFGYEACGECGRGGDLGGAGGCGGRARGCWWGELELWPVRGRLDDFDRKGWRNRVRPIGEPSIEYVGLTNRGEDHQDRVVVRIEARLSDYVEDAYGQRVGRVDAAGDTTRVREFWTLVKRDGH